jgi:predicted dehydrogenase
MGKNHARVFSTLRYTDLVGVCDQNEAAGRALAHQYDTRYFASVGDLLPEVDAVSIVTPTSTHFDLAMQCLEHGLDIFVEKPITETVLHAELLAAAAVNRERILQVGHIERFNPAYAELKHVLEEMTVLVVNFERLSPYIGSNIDVDVVLDLMIHDLDLVMDLVGAEPVGIEARGLAAFSGAIDHAYVSLQFETGPLLSVTASRVTEQKVRKIEATALEAYIDGDLLNKTVSVHRGTVGNYLNQNHRGVKYRQESVVERIHVPSAEPLFLELQHFVECVQRRETPLVTPEHGLRALRLALQIRKSIYSQMRETERGNGMESASGRYRLPVPVAHNGVAAATTL